jgi:beta-lactamase class A
MQPRQFSGRSLARGGLFSIFLLVAAVGFATEEALERELQRLGALSGGVMGVAAVHLESGRRAFLNGDEPFPMASTYKVPIAVELLHRVDEGKLDLARMVAVERHDYSPGSGLLTDLINQPGLSLSLRNLLEIMLLVSDNTATDLCLRHAGGGEAVTARMRNLGIEGISVDRPTVRLIADWRGFAVPEEGERDPAKYGELFDSVPEGRAEEAERVFYDDPRDTATPRAMAALLEKIWMREALTPASSELLLDIMKRCRTGASRLKGILPEGTKSGTRRGPSKDPERRRHHHPSERSGTRDRRRFREEVGSSGSGAGASHRGSGARGVRLLPLHLEVIVDRTPPARSALEELPLISKDPRLEDFGIRLLW